jgi:hypothetical protein
MSILTTTEDGFVPLAVSQCGRKDDIIAWLGIQLGCDGEVGDGATGGSKRREQRDEHYES